MRSILTELLPLALVAAVPLVVLGVVITVVLIVRASRRGARTTQPAPSGVIEG